MATTMTAGQQLVELRQRLETVRRQKQATDALAERILDLIAEKERELQKGETK